MRRVLLLAAALAVAAGTAGGSPAKPEHELLFGLADFGGSASLTHFDPDTLAPVGRRLVVGRLDGFAYDSLGWFAYADGTRVRIVDPDTMRQFASIRLYTGRPVAVGWLRWPSIVVVSGTTLIEIRRVDWGSRKVVRTARLQGTVLDQAHGDDELVLLLGPNEGIGPSRLLVIDSLGRARVIPVDRIPVGSQFNGDASPPTGESRAPAIALDAPHDKAYVVGDGLIAEVPLSGSASYHVLRGRFSKMIAGSWRSAAWLGSGTLAVAGRASADGHRVEPMGLELVDTETWTSRVVDRGVSSVERWQDLVLTTGATWSDEERANGMGLAAFDATGAERFRIFPGQLIGLGVTAMRAYVQLGVDSTAIVELPSGRIVAQLDRDLPYLLTLR